MASGPLQSIIQTPSLRLALIFLPNFAWFFAGFVQFALRPKRFRGALSPAARKQEPKIGDAWHHDIVVYLGAMGGAISLSVLDAAFTDLFRGGLAPAALLLYLRLWGAAHASQGFVGWTRIYPSGRWNWRRYLGPITYTDTILTVWNFTLALAHS